MAPLLETGLFRNAVPRALVAAALLAGTSGCVHVYQPVSGLHGPVVIDPGVANFPELQLDVVCNQGDLLNRQETRRLCENVGTLFRNQGAQVTTQIGDEGPNGFELQEAEDNPLPFGLVLELTSREVHTFNDPVMWTLCILSASVLPAVSESSFSLEVLIRDRTGFLLGMDTLEGRIVRRMGVGVWAVEKSLDLIVREEDERMGGDAAERDLSEDLYGQLSQMVFNAQMQSAVLQQLPPTEP